ncbi:MAG: hypothetical protein GWN67_04355, partial [Phycisphaerae bacterium]|nr:hypothetical protein [Phycisphaerae bacterium]NIP56453.1 hypothetical protein [Phycisphaerae bacterium]NIS54908.1 hypothetical protein [Phycisphaerae bacterium]NIU08095.1 hypothetical protein [Phycisphaerae bacterium]NIU55638.1 hypothetical protein [Phycisphaerae bacterium]
MKKLIFAFTCFFLAIPCRARIITVDDNGPADFNNIQAAINDANDGDTIIVADGIYTGNGNRDIDFIGKAITLRSKKGPDNCVIDCQGGYIDGHRGFNFLNGEDSNSVLDGFTIKNGLAWNENGGAILIENSGPTIRNCIAKYNSAEIHMIGGGNGGGISCENNSNPIIVNCSFYYNSSDSRGGGIFSWESSPIISCCAFVANEGDHGGAMACRGGNALIKDCNIIGNQAEITGGGLYFYQSEVASVIRCNIESNQADGGGGIGCVECSPLIQNCTICKGLARFGGGGISCADGSNPVIMNCTIVQNEVHSLNGIYGRGGGVRCYWSNPILYNCILWDNYANWTGPQISLRYSSSWPSVVTVLYSNIQGGQSDVHVDNGSTLIWGEGNIDTDPLFANVNNGDYHLKSQAGRWDPASESWVIDDVTSPCIDAGNPGCTLGDEPNEPNNVLRNMGAYGGTAEASKSPANWRSIADMTNDWVVDSNDLKAFVDYWMQTGDCIPSDLNRSQSVDFNDFAIFGLQWSYPTAFETGMTFHVDDCNMEAGLNQPAVVESSEPRFKVWIEGRYIHFEDQMYANCCPDELGLDKEINGNQITLYEIGYGGMCDCMCYFPITATLGPFEDGVYTVEVYDNYGKSLGVVEVTIGGSTGPDITF